MASLTVRRSIFVLVAVAVAACSTPQHTVVPKPDTDRAKLPGFTNVRYWGDEAIPPAMYEPFVKDKYRIVRARRARGEKVVLTALSLSGGGSDGAFGSGFLNGWTAHGTRPTFDVVTGISTGSLIAPFAFLGSKYDPQLKTVYTTITTRDIVRKDILRGLLGGSAVADSRPLFRLISKYLTKEIMAEIAEEHEKNARRLYVGTTNVEAQRPVIWDIGAIAASGNPGSLDLIRRILLASSSVPGGFPPVLIDVEIDGKKFQEVHADGGVTTQTFLFPGASHMSIIRKRMGASRVERRVYIMRNGKIAPEWQSTELGTFSMAGRAISTLIKYQANGDLAKLYGISRRERFDYNLAHIPASFDVPSKEAFDKAQMNALYKVGYDLARAGYKWKKKPPDFLSPGQR